MRQGDGPESSSKDVKLPTSDKKTDKDLVAYKDLSSEKDDYVRQERSGKRHPLKADSQSDQIVSSPKLSTMKHADAIIN